MMGHKRSAIAAVGICIFGLLCVSDIKCSDAKGHRMEPKLVEIDPDQPANVEYKVCGGDVAPDSSCPCDLDGLTGEFIVTNAYLSDASGVKHNLSHKAHSDNCITLQVEVPIPGNSFPGEYKYSIGYDYKCEGILGHCNGKSKQMELTVIVVDYKLRLIASDVGTSVQETNKETEPSKVVISSEKIGSNVSLECSSGLSAKDSSPTNIPVLFTFLKDGLQSDSNYTKTMECKDTGEVADGYVTQSSNWIISRKNVPPGDCVLTITNFGPNDVGEYNCAGLLSIDGSIYESDWSQKSIDLEETKPESISKLYALFALSLVVLVLGAIALFYLYHKRRQPHIQREPGPPEENFEESYLIPHRLLQQSYDSTATQETTITDPPSPNPSDTPSTISATTKATKEGVKYYKEYMGQEGGDSDSKTSQDSDDPGKESPQQSAAGSSSSSPGHIGEPVPDTPSD